MGLTVQPSELHPGNYKLRNPLEFVDKMSAYNSHQFDSVAYEMQIEVCQDLINPSQKEGKDVYYFARRGDVSFNAHPLYLPTLKCDPLSAVTELITGNIIWPHLRRRKYKVRKDWKPNDGMVNVIGQSAPLTSEYTDFKSPKSKARHLVQHACRRKKSPCMGRFTPKSIQVSQIFCRCN